MLPNFGGTDHLVIFALVALLVFKPQDLPLIMKKAGQFLASARRMAADFRASFEDMARQSELDQLRQEVEAMKAKAVEMTSSHTSVITDALTATADQIGSHLEDQPGPGVEYVQWNNPAPEPVIETTVPTARKTARKTAPKTTSADGPKPTGKTPAKKPARSPAPKKAPPK